jgi:hypothetical protein
MNIRNVKHYVDSFWDWSPLNDCFGGTDIRVTDVDGSIERHGRYLHLETKQPGTDILFGQSMFYEGLVNAGHSVLFMWGPVNDPRKLYLVTPHRQKVYDPADWSTVQQVVGEWFKWADKQPKAFVYRGICKLPEGFA